MKVAIHWFRRDLRLTDNTALNAAAKSADVRRSRLILSDWQKHHHWTGPNRQEFLCACLGSLSKNLVAIGSRLVIRGGPAERELERLVAETGAGAIFCNRDPDPFGRAVEESLWPRSPSAWASCFPRIRTWPCTNATNSCPARACRTVPTRRTSRRGPRLPNRRSVPGPSNWAPRRASQSLPLPDLSHWKLRSEGARLIEAGERAARRRLSAFLEQGGGAGALRGRPDGVDGTNDLAVFAGFALGSAVGARGVPPLPRAGRRIGCAGPQHIEKVPRRNRVAGLQFPGALPFPERAGRGI